MRSPHYQKDKQLLENWTSGNVSFQKGEINDEEDEEDIDDDTMGKAVVDDVTGYAEVFLSKSDTQPPLLQVLVRVPALMV